MPKSFDLVIGDKPYLFPPNKPGITLGSALTEPSQASQVGTIAIESMHGGAGKIIEQQGVPFAYLDTNGEILGADARQPGFIMPGGYLHEIGSVPRTGATLPSFQSRAASFINAIVSTSLSPHLGGVVFAIGQQLLHVDITNDAVTSIDALSGSFFSGGWVQWNGSYWLGCTSGVYQFAPSPVFTNDANYNFSWATSTRNGLFWIDNSFSPPTLRWSDKTNENLTSIDPDPDDGFVYGPFYLEVPQLLITGMGMAGAYPVFANSAGGLWGFDNTEVFLPLTPNDPSHYLDTSYGGQLVSAGNYLLIPSQDGLTRFDTHSLTVEDITPANYQLAAPNFTNSVSRAVDFVAPSPTGAVIATRFGNSSPSILYLELYPGESRQSMHYHIAVSEMPIPRVHGIVVARNTTIFSGSATPSNSSQRLYILGSDESFENWIIYRLDVPTQGWQPGPENIAPVSALKTSEYGIRPQGVTGKPLQVRGWAQASSQNYISIAMSVDGAEPIELGKLDVTGPFVLPVPGNLLPGRRFSLSVTLTCTNNAGLVPYIALPMNIDYVYAPQADDHADHISLIVMATSDFVDKNMGSQFRSGVGDMDFLVGLQGKFTTVTFGDRIDSPNWNVFVENVQAVLAEQDQGNVSTAYQVTIVARRVD